MQISDRQLLSNEHPQQITPARMATVKRTTGETDVQVTVNLDGTGICIANTGIP
ncbi:MAG TPA: imidazoleglycerol-phosphate dehydratase, partial [Phormidium sp.]